MKPFRILAIPVIFLVASSANAGPASSKLSALSELLIKNYSSKAGAQRTTLAVFPFSCDEKLRKRRAGFAVSELMAHRFVANRDFEVVERGEVGRVLSEQRFQASGAVDSDTAVKLGKILGAGTILVGNLQKVDGMYQVNARLVNAETGKIIVSGFVEFPAGAFEDDARMYLSLVPEEQTLGLYAVYSYRSNDNAVGTSVEPFASGTLTRTPSQFSTHLAGGGMLYRPKKNLQISADCVTSTTRGKYDDVVLSASPGSGPSYMDMTVLSVGGAYVGMLADKLAYSAGLGLQNMWVNTGSADAKKGNPPIGIFAKAGMEFKPQARVGVGVNFKYSLSDMSVSSEYGNKILELSPLSLETVLAFYF